MKIESAVPFVQTTLPAAPAKKRPKSPPLRAVLLLLVALYLLVDSLLISRRAQSAIHQILAAIEFLGFVTGLGLSVVAFEVRRVQNTSA